MSRTAIIQNQHAVVPPPTKSVGLSLVLTLLFGPLGLLYASVEAALIMILFTIAVSIFTLGAGVLVVWPVSMIWGAYAAMSYNRLKITAYTG
jgi:hypothetical protein